MQRILEPEVMDSWEEAIEYDAMDFKEVNTAFAQRAIALAPADGKILDAGTGTARIPILMCQLSEVRSPWQMTAIDLSKNMLLVAQQNITEAGLQAQIQLNLVDAKQMPYEDQEFDFVISNSIVHHLPDPLPFFQEIQRVLKPNGGMLIRDLFRPQDQATLDAMVAEVGGDYNHHQTQLFRDSLQAAFTVDEVKELIAAARLTGVKVYQSSARHWTAERFWKAA